MIRQRKLFTALQSHLEDKRHSIITGARQVGKTSLLRLILKQLEAEQRQVYYLTLENPVVLDAINQNPEQVFQFIAAHPQSILEGIQKDRIFLLLDEVQYADNPTHFLKYIYDQYERNVKIIATGSSAFYIDQKFTDSLAGRKRIFHLYPLSLEEFLDFKGAQDLLEELELLKKQPNYQSLKRTALEQMFLEYLLYGGYPAVVLEEDFEEKKFLLSELKNAYVKRDILESGVEKEGKFYLLLQLLADQIGNLVNKNELSNIVQIDAKTIDQYLYILQKCYHLQLIRPFYRNLRKELTKMPKCYFNDLGLRNAFLNRLSPISQRADKGALLENYFFLRFRASYQMDQIKFWRTTDQKEMDFIIEEQFNEGRAIEVKWNAANFKPKKYQKFVDAYAGFELEVLSAGDFWKS
ncbi:MAG: ATP-binding protein [Bacteroidota bacterium]